MCWLQLVDICFASWLVSELICFCRLCMTCSVCSCSDSCVRLLSHASWLIWSLCCICDMLLLVWLLRWMLWCALACWFESSSCSASSLHAHLNIAESSFICLVFKLMWRISWLLLLSAILPACWTCTACKIDEWVHISLNWTMLCIIWLSSSIFHELSSTCSSSVL